MAMREDVKANADLQGLLKQARMYPVSFGGQRSIQLSYGRLSASIDETRASGNGLDFARLDVGGASCGKVRAFESSRARQLSCAEGVPGKFIVGSSHATLVMVLVTPPARQPARREEATLCRLQGVSLTVLPCLGSIKTRRRVRGTAPFTMLSTNNGQQSVRRLDSYAANDPERSFRVSLMPIRGYIFRRER